MHRETPIRRSLLPGSLPRGAENSNRYTVRIEFPVSHRKQRTEPNSNRYTKCRVLASLCITPGRSLLPSRCIIPGRSLLPSRRLVPRHFSAAHFRKINRNTALIESPISHSKQRSAHQINRNISRARLARLAPPTPQTLNPTTCQINRHTLLLEFAVSYRKQSSLIILIATKTVVLPQRSSGFGGHDFSFQNAADVAMMLSKSAMPKGNFSGCASLRSRDG